MKCVAHQAATRRQPETTSPEFVRKDSGTKKPRAPAHPMGSTRASSSGIAQAPRETAPVGCVDRAPGESGLPRHAGEPRVAARAQSGPPARHRKDEAGPPAAAARRRPHGGGHGHDGADSPAGSAHSGTPSRSCRPTPQDHETGPALTKLERTAGYVDLARRRAQVAIAHARRRAGASGHTRRPCRSAIDADRVGPVPCAGGTAKPTPARSGPGRCRWSSDSGGTAGANRVGVRWNPRTQTR